MLGAAVLGEQVWSLGEQVVAQIHDQQLGGERLVGVPRRTLALASPALGTGGEVEHLLPGEVLHLADANDRLLLLHQALEVGSGGQRAERFGSRLVSTLIGAMKMCRCLEYVTSTRKP